MNNEVHTCDRIFSLIEEINMETLNEFYNINEFVDLFMVEYRVEKQKLPYHINIIDELNADENAHSRIFAKLLRYKENNKYPFLEKFLNDVCEFKLKIEKPEVKKVDSCGRIDIPIFDKKYVVVIENKVTDKAPDQNEKGGQLARYIETIKNNYSREFDEIFVVYTPKYTREPADECWKIEKENDTVFSYKDGFKNRFCSASYRDVIYPWLKNEILPTIDKKNIYLRSAVEQYLDHLEGEKMFNLRIINKKMNMKLQEFIKQKFGIQDNNLEEAIKILSEKEEDLNNVINQIQQLKSEYQKQNALNHFEKWEKSLHIDFPNCKIVGDKFKLDKNCINVGILFEYESVKFTVLIEKGTTIYYGIGRQYASQELVPEIKSFIKPIWEKRGATNWFYDWEYTSFENGYDRLKTLIEKVILLLEENEKN